MPGRTALLWAAQLAPNEPEATALRLHEAIERRFDEQGVCLAQASLPDKPTLCEARLRASGYRHLADIRYLACTLDDLDEFSVPHVRSREEVDGSELAFEAYHQANHDRLAAVVEQTYRQTLDCPALDGLRNIDDVLEGYRHTGVFDPQRWMTVRHGARDVGCLLLADHPQQNQWELVYMGLLPEVRGKQWGLAVTRHAQRLAAAAGRQRLVLAVDAGNSPALAMYRAANFVAWDQRRVFLKALHRDS
jgi:ribosomal protein S18 acetylase RimI-like enzyme